MATLIDADMDMDMDMGIVIKQKKILTVSSNIALFYDPSNGHHSLRALTHLPTDSVLHEFSAREYVDTPTYLSVQVDDNLHIYLAPEFLQYINHSCEPNVFFDTKNEKIIAIKDISPDEEITFFYPSTEWSMNQPFLCFCQTESCIGRVQGSRYLPQVLRNKYQFNEHITKKFDI